MAQQHAEEYLGAVFRLRKGPEYPLPLHHLQSYFGFSPISIHEMVQKLEEQGYIDYIPYRGVLLSPVGEQVAAALVRRHRIWERFLTDMLAIPADSVHQVADQLEHAAPELVTERLSLLLGQPDACPHGSLIPAGKVEHGRENAE
jgi:DtxR family transcriptional regulator, Mn-dependent transcriptional regulator